ncbi:MAG: TonB-dependent receptor, partial [Pseudomonadota bacterium]
VAVFDLTIDTDVQNWAVFGEAEYQITDRLSVLFGARYDSEEFARVVTEDRTGSDAIALAILNGDVPGFPAFPPFDQNIETTFEAFLPKGVITYDWTDDLSTSFSVQRAYRGGGAGQIGLPPLGTDPRFSYDPEYTTTYEGALRSVWLGGDLTVNANVFFTEWEDQQTSFLVAPFNPANTLVVNAAESTLYGAEVDVRARISDALDVYFGLGLLNTEFDDFDVTTALGGIPTTGGNFTGNKFPGAPETTVAAGFNYRHPAGFYVNGNYSYASEQEGDAANSDVRRLDSRNIVDLIAGYETDRYRLELFARNLFDEDYKLATELAIDDASQLSGFLQGDPQLIGGRLVLTY